MIICQLVIFVRTEADNHEWEFDDQVFPEMPRLGESIWASIYPDSSGMGGVEIVATVTDVAWFLPDEDESELGVTLHVDAELKGENASKAILMMKLKSPVPVAAAMGKRPKSKVKSGKKTAKRK